MGKYIPVLLIGITLAITSCEGFFEQDVEIDIPEHEPVLAVVAEFSSTDTILKSYISHSLGILDSSQFQSIKNALVQLFKDGNPLYELPYTEDFASGLDGGYELEINHPLGTDPAEYRLRVEAPGYSTVESVQAMPLPVPITGFDFTKDGAASPTGEPADQIEVKIADPGGVENYYSFLLEVNISRPDTGSDVFFTANLQSNDDQIEEGDSELLLSDESFDGKEQVIRFYTNALISENSTVAFYFHLRSITRDKYLYSRALNIYYESEDNPFAEPIVIPSNIENGYGMFSVESETVFEKEYKF